jgi:hypothetical protein
MFVLLNFFHWLYSPLGPWPLVFLFRQHFTDGRTPWMSDQLVARPLPKHRTSQTQNKHRRIPNIRALYGIRTHDPGLLASEGSTCLGLRGYCDQQAKHIAYINRHENIYYSLSQCDSKCSANVGPTE